RHRRLARLGIAVRRAAYGVAVATRPHPGPTDRSDRVEEENATDDGAVLHHVIVVLVPAERRGFEDQPRRHRSALHLRNDPLAVLLEGAKARLQRLKHVLRPRGLLPALVQLPNESFLPRPGFVRELGTLALEKRLFLNVRRRRGFGPVRGFGDGDDLAHATLRACPHSRSSPPSGARMLRSQSPRSSSSNSVTPVSRPNTVGPQGSTASRWISK